MTPTPPFGMPQMDPSQLDPKVLMELSQLVQQLPPDKLSRMQTLMHNMMAGFDVRREMEEFEQSLPPGFREKLMTIMGGQAAAFGGMGFPSGAEFTPSTPTDSSASLTQEDDAGFGASGATSTEDMSMREARMTILRAVADQKMAPEDAERLLFNAAS